MSEGEFKKRLREMVDSGQIIHNEDEIFSGWIDEARKDWIENVTSEGDYTPDEWFLKWLGNQ